MRFHPLPNNNKWTDVIVVTVSVVSVDGDAVESIASFVGESIGNKEDILRVSLLIMNDKADSPRWLVVLFYTYSS